MDQFGEFVKQSGDLTFNELQDAKVCFIQRVQNMNFLLSLTPVKMVIPLPKINSLLSSVRFHRLRGFATYARSSSVFRVAV